MKHIFTILLSLLLISCFHENNKQEIEFSTTEELQFQKADVISYSIKRDRDIVDHLYQEALDKDANLKLLEKKIGNIDEDIADSLSNYNEYLNYNELYYTSAQNYIHQIGDSTKRAFIESYFTASNENFSNKISKFSNLPETTSALKRELKDQHVILKLIISEQLIKIYQENEPDLAPIKAVNNELLELINECKEYSSPK